MIFRVFVKDGKKKVIMNLQKKLKNLTPRQFEIIENLTNALYDVQEELIKK